MMYIFNVHVRQPIWILNLWFWEQKYVKQKREKNEFLS